MHIYMFQFVMTLIILKGLDALLKATTGFGVRVTEEVEVLGLDISEHGETMFSSHYPVKPAAWDAGNVLDTIPMTSVYSNINAVHPFEVTSVDP